MSDSDFLTLLVDETFKLQESGEDKLSSLELKLDDYNLEYLKGEFIPQNQILRFNTPFGVLDAPINWSIFSLDNVNSESVILDQFHDLDHFYSVLKTAWNPSFAKVLITHADGFCYVVGLKAGEDTHIHDLLNPVWIKAA